MSPLAVIVTPGRELAAQIKEVTEILVSDLDLKVKMSTGSFVQQKIEKMRREPVDILIGSVGGLNKMFDGSLYFADFVDTVVLDEVDTMIDETFQGVTSSFLARLRKKIEQQYIFAGATFPTTLDTSLGHVIDTEHLKIIQTPFLHKVMPHVYQKFIKTPKVARLDYLLDIIEPDVDKNRQVLIFSNKASTAAYISHSLNERRIPALLFSGGNMKPYLRHRHLSEFMKKECNILSCTDLASRGIDTGNVEHVINYDFPISMTDYLHRVGRVGRAGSNVQNCKVTNLVCGKIGVALVQELEKSVRLNKAVPCVESNVKSVFETYKSSSISRMQPKSEDFEIEQ